MEDITIIPQSYDFNVEPESYISVSPPTTIGHPVSDNEIEIVPQYDVIEIQPTPHKEKKVRENGEILLEILENLKEIKHLLHATLDTRQTVLSEDIDASGI